MKLTDYALIAGVVALIVWDIAGRSGDNAEHQRMKARADSLAGAIIDSNAAYNSRRATDSAELAIRETRIIRLRASYNATIAHTDSLLGDSLLGTTVPDSGTSRDSLRGMVTELRMALTNERMAAANVITQQDSAIQQLRRQLVFWRDTVVDRKDQQLRATQALLTECLSRSRPRHGWKTDAALLIGGVVAGHLIR